MVSRLLLPLSAGWADLSGGDLSLHTSCGVESGRRPSVRQIEEGCGGMLLQPTAERLVRAGALKNPLRAGAKARECYDGDVSHVVCNPHPPSFCTQPSFPLTPPSLVI